MQLLLGPGFNPWSRSIAYFLIFLKVHSILIEWGWPSVAKASPTSRRDFVEYLGRENMAERSEDMFSSRRVTLPR